MDIAVGNILRVRKERYQVLTLFEEIDYYDTQKNQSTGKHIAVQLHKIEDPSLHPTHLLKMYHDGRISILKIVQERPLEWLKNPRQRGGMFKYIDEKKITTSDITVESVE